MDPERSTRYVLEGPELVHYLAQQAAEDAKTALLERDERRNRRTAFLMSIIALVGVGSLMSALKIFVRGEVDVLQTQFKEQREAVEKLVADRAETLQADFKARIETAVGKSVDAKVGSVIKTLEENDQFEQYAELAQLLPDKLLRSNQQGDKEKYVAEALREVLQSAEQLAAVPRFTKRARFITATRQIVDTMTRYDRESEINRLDDILGNQMVSDQEMARILVDHYGQLVIGSPQPIDALPDEMPRLARYMRAAKERNYPEKALLWSLFVEFKRNNYQRSATTARLLESSRDLSEYDRTEFWFNMFVYTDPKNWLRNETQQGRELKRLTLELAQQYSDSDISGILKGNLESPQLAERVANLRQRNPDLISALGVGPEPAAESAVAPAAEPPAAPPVQSAAETAFESPQAAPSAASVAPAAEAAVPQQEPNALR